jgi:hypothetical protein
MTNEVLNRTKAAILSGLISAGSMAGEVANKVKAYCAEATPTAVLTRVQNDEAEPVNRLEVLGQLPGNLDYYGMAEEQGDSNFWKARAQWLPLKKGPLSFGVVGQHMNGSKFPEHNEAGPVVRLSGKPVKGLFGKLDLRYFPDRESFDWYGLLNSKRFYADCLGVYNHETEKGFVRPGLDIKLGKDFSVGVEGKLAGHKDDLRQKYVGVRVKKKF